MTTYFRAHLLEQYRDEFGDRTLTVLMNKRSGAISSMRERSDSDGFDRLMTTMLDRNYHVRTYIGINSAGSDQIHRHLPNIETDVEELGKSLDQIVIDPRYIDSMNPPSEKIKS